MYWHFIRSAIRWIQQKKRQLQKNRRTVQWDKNSTKDELNRVTINESDKILVLDVHGLNKNETAKLMNNLIAATRNAFTFRIIHGYNHGVVLKTFINNEYKNKRVENIVSMVNNNLGMTDLYVKNA